jgi:hypothetical protein
MKKRISALHLANFANPANTRMATGLTPSQRFANLCESPNHLVSNAQPPSVPSIQEEAPAQLDSTQLNQNPKGLACN